MSFHQITNSTWILHILKLDETHLYFEKPISGLFQPWTSWTIFMTLGVLKFLFMYLKKYCKGISMRLCQFYDNKMNKLKHTKASYYSKFTLLIVLYWGLYPLYIFSFTIAYLKRTQWKFKPLLSVGIMNAVWSCSATLLSPYRQRESSPPSSFLLIFPSTFYPGKPPATVYMTHSTHLLYCTVGGPADKKHFTRSTYLLSAHTSSQSKLLYVIMLTNFAGL